MIRTPQIHGDKGQVVILIAYLDNFHPQTIMFCLMSCLLISFSAVPAAVANIHNCYYQNI